METLDTVIRIANFVKTRALNSRLLLKLRQDMGSVHEPLLFYTQVVAWFFVQQCPLVIWQAWK